jgi:hypothetical protein
MPINSESVRYGSLDMRQKRIVIYGGTDVPESAVRLAHHVVRALLVQIRHGSGEANRRLNRFCVTWEIFCVFSSAARPLRSGLIAIHPASET